VVGEATVSNGLEWSPDGTLAYYVDSATGRIDVFDYGRDVGLVERRPFATIEGGIPDGLTVDAEGGVWVALWRGSSVRRYAPDGALSAVIEVPATQVTACTFGGVHLDELYITTSREGLAPGDEPRAGALYVARPGVLGLPVRRFAG
jgi:sugar lactone lactonase YvrE